MKLLVQAWFFITCTILFTLLFSSVASAKVTINEFSSGTSEDWVELYNTTDATAAANLTEYALKDSLDSTIGGELMGLLAPGQRYVIEVGKRLNVDQDTVRLFNKSELNTPIESISYGNGGSVCAPDASESIGRSPDGLGGFMRFQTPTKGSVNSSSLSACPTQVPTSTPSPTVTSTPSATSTPVPLTPSPTIKKTATPKPTARKEEPNSTAEVLGKSDVKTPEPSPSSSPLVKASFLTNFPPIALIFIGGGLLCLIGAISPLLVKQIRLYNSKVYKNEHENDEDS